MANIKLSFLGTLQSGTEEHELECLINNNNEIFISIDDGTQPSQHICLDISTAIKFSKTLRTNINLAKDWSNE